MAQGLGRAKSASLRELLASRLPSWRLRASHICLDVQLHRRAGSTDARSEADEGISPHHQVALSSSTDLPRDVTFDCAVRYVDGIIHFIMVGDRTRFGINPDAARRANLRISPKLLGLAKIVRDGDPAHERE